MTVRRAWLIYNPTAGRFPAGPLLGRATRVLVNAGWDVQQVTTEDKFALSELASQAVNADCQAVFVAGGDGSVGRVAAILAGTQTALGVLPAGTANVWAQEIGLPHLDYGHLFALEQAAARLAHGNIRLVDLGECNGQPFLLWAGIGLAAKVINSIEPRVRWEKLFSIAHYATIALWSSIGWEGIDLKAHASGKKWSGRFLIAVACNIPGYAGGLAELAPGAQVDDGLLDFWLIGGETVRDVVARVVQVFRGTHVDAPGVVHFRAGEATFEIETDTPMQLDGEPWVMESPIQFNIRRKVLRVLVPADVSSRLFISNLPG